MNSRVDGIPEQSPESASEADGVDLERVKRVLEAALLTTQEPMSLGDLRKLFEQDLGTETLRRLLEEIGGEWAGRGVELTQVASGWRFRTKADMQVFLDRLSPQRPPKYSRAVLETLAIIAYRQPVTRGDIEDVRGVTVSTNIVKALEARGWIEVIGHREVPGRPALYATTRQFLDDLGLRSLEDLPPLEDLGTLVDANTGAEDAGSDLQGNLDLRDALIEAKPDSAEVVEALGSPEGESAQVEAALAQDASDRKASDERLEDAAAASGEYSEQDRSRSQSA